MNCVLSLMMQPCVVVGQEWEEKRRHNIEKMNEEMERIAEYERGQRVRGSTLFYRVSDGIRLTCLGFLSINSTCSYKCLVFNFCCPSIQSFFFFFFLE